MEHLQKNKNKFNGCNSKYLFTTEELNNIECPKERIMINWERTEIKWKKKE